MDGIRGEGPDGEGTGREEPLRLLLPRLTTIRPDECGFKLPDRRYLRLYQHGVQEELPDGRPIGFAGDGPRPQWTAYRFRVGDGPWPGGTLEDIAHVTKHSVEIELSDTLACMDDRALIALCHRIMRRIIELEIALDLGGYRRRSAPGYGVGVVHVVDLRVDDQFGLAPVA